MMLYYMLFINTVTQILKKKKLAVTKPTKEEKGNLYSVVMISPETESVEQITLGKFHDLIQRKS